MVLLTPSSFQHSIGRVSLHYKVGDAVKHLDDIEVHPGAPYKDNQVVISSTFAPGETCGYFLQLNLESQVDLELIHLEVAYTMEMKGLKMMNNGFQSWSQSREGGIHDKLTSIPSDIPALKQHFFEGDYHFYHYAGEPGKLHSTSYTHFRGDDQRVCFFGSLTEHLGYTYFKADFNTNTFGIYKDVAGMFVSAGKDPNLPLIRVWVHDNSGPSAVKDLWENFSTCLWVQDGKNINSAGTLARVNSLKKTESHVTGWTSWYNYYRDVSEAIVLENVQKYQEHGYPIDIVQIDDGFQTASSDWLSPNDKFPSGMSYLARKIHDAGFKAGLWLAPFAAAFGSKVAKETPEWLVQDPSTGKPLVAGDNWDGFYALDIYQEPVRKYLKHVFKVVLRDWEYDLVKLDFLYAAALVPRNGKSRGQIMDDAMRLLRDECIGNDKLMLACGVPLAPTWGRADYCRIGSDVAPWWDNDEFRQYHVRERVATFNSLRSTLGRWAMSGCVFGNDPDVVIIRNSDDVKLTEDERYTLCVLNNVLGQLVFCSDNVDRYDQDQHMIYGASFPKIVPSVSRVTEILPDLYLLDYRHAEVRYVTYTNLAGHDQKIDLPDDACLWFSPTYTLHCHRESSIDAPDWYLPFTTLQLRAHETRTFMAIAPPTGKDQITFLGSTGHLVPGAEIASVQQVKDNGVQVSLQRGHRKRHRLYFALSGSLMQLSDSERLSASSVHAKDIIVNGKHIEFTQARVQGKSPAKIMVAMVDNL